MSTVQAKPVVTILATGLIGGSLGLALRESGFAAEVVGWGRSAERLQRALERGAIDRFTLDLAEAVAAASIVVIATPTLLAEQLLGQVLDLAGGQTVVTDVASVKGNLLAAALRHTGGEVPANLVLAHPIAGSEQSGIEAARADLFQRHKVILTPEPLTEPAALTLVNSMWASTGADVVAMPVAEHDRVLAATSHLPHVLAYTLVDALAGSGADEYGSDVLRFAAGGFRDFTRIASSDPTMWHDIVLANRTAVLAGMDQFSSHLEALRAAIAAGDSAAIMACFSRAQSARERFLALLAGQDPSTQGEE